MDENFFQAKVVSLVLFFLLSYAIPHTQRTGRPSRELVIYDSLGIEVFQLAIFLGVCTNCPVQTKLLNPKNQFQKLVHNAARLPGQGLICYNMQSPNCDELSQNYH